MKDELNKSHGDEESSKQSSDSREVRGSKRKTRLVWIATMSVLVVGLSVLGVSALYSGQIDRLYSSCVVIKSPLANFNTQADAQTVLGEWELDDEGEFKDSSSEFVYDGNRLEMFSTAQLDEFEFSILPEMGRYKTNLETITVLWPLVRASVGDLKNTSEGKEYRILELQYRQGAIDQLEFLAEMTDVVYEATIRGEEAVLPKALERKGDLLAKRQKELKDAASELAKQISNGEAFSKFQRNMDDLTVAINGVREICNAKNFGSRPGQR